MDVRTSPCGVCGSTARPVARALGACLDCIRSRPEEALPRAAEAHVHARLRLGLPPETPASPGGVPCTLCAHACRMAEGDVGYCGLRRNRGGRLESVAGPGRALFHAYTDPQVTNCCAAWFCPAGTGAGFPRYAARDGPETGCLNLAIFLYGCNFDCLFCQNFSHKLLSGVRAGSARDLVEATRADGRITCWCFFGGSPEPQLPFAIDASRKVRDAVGGDRVLRICFEWNGCGHPKLVERAVELALSSGGNVKFDLKAFDPNLSLALSGVPNRQAYENFATAYGKFYGQRAGLPVLTATTLLVPGYVDEREVGAIAGFLADLDPSIPYSLLAFHPDYLLDDLPRTPAAQVEACVRAARGRLENVHVGNVHLLA